MRMIILIVIVAVHDQLIPGLFPKCSFVTCGLFGCCSSNNLIIFFLFLPVLLILVLLVFQDLHSF